MSVYESAADFVRSVYGTQREMMKRRLPFGARLLMINIMLAANEGAVKV